MLVPNNPPSHFCFRFAASDVANFDGGSSSILYRPSATLSRTSISLKFKTLKSCGTLLHAEGRRDHSLTLVLERGRLLLYHQQGTDKQSVVSKRTNTKPNETQAATVGQRIVGTPGGDKSKTLLSGALGPQCRLSFANLAD